MYFWYLLILDVLQADNGPRPLTFDPTSHKVLNSELKHLYTALTRARVNVWLFDEDLDKRAPMFQYFKARKLVKSLKVSDINDSGEIILMGHIFSWTCLFLHPPPYYVKSSL